MGTGRKGRSCAWPPSRGVTSKSPMHAGAASSLGLHARLARRVRQRRRCYQSGKEGPRTAAGRDAGRRIGGRYRAGGIDRARRRVSGPGRRASLVLLGDPPSFDEDDSDPHCCVKPLDAVALPSLAATAACRTRHGPPASCSAPIASRLRCLLTVRPGCLPGHRDYLARHDSPGFDQGLLLRPLVPRERSRGLARPPPAVSDVHVARDRAHGASGSIRPPPPVDRAAWRIRAHAGASPAATPPYSRIAQLRFGTWASPSTSYGCRARTGSPPACWSPSLPGWLPTTPPQGGSNMAATVAPAPRRHQRNLLSTLGATAREADLAPRHYRIPPPGDIPRKTTSAASGDRNGSDGALRLRPPSRRTPPRRVSSSRWRGSPRCRGSPGSPPTGRSGRSRRPSAAPASRLSLPGPSAHTATIRP